MTRILRHASCSCGRLIARYLSPWPDYQRHLARLVFRSCRELEHLRRRVDQLPYRPTISILTPVHKLDPRWLSECLESLGEQVYESWELCIVEDGSGMNDLRTVIRGFAERYPDRAHVVLRDDNWGIARTSQQALDMATGDYVLPLDHDDWLAPDALAEVALRLNQDPDIDWIYSDHDKIAQDGTRWQHYLKPDWSPDLFLCSNYALHLTALRRQLVLDVGGFRAEFEGSQDYDLYLRIADRTSAVAHLPRVLYSWREAPTSLARDLGHKPSAFRTGARSLADTLARRGQAGVVENAPHAWAGNYRIRYEAKSTSVDLLILGESAREDPASTWTSDSPMVRICATHRPVVGESGGTALARALQHTHASYLFITFAQATPASPSTLPDLVRGFAVTGVAALTAKIMGTGTKVDHCGLAFAPGGRMLFPLRGFSANDPAYGAYGTLTRTVSASSPVAVVMDVEKLRETGGFDASLDTCGAVIDSCFALRNAGYRIVADGSARVILHGAPFAPGTSMIEGGHDLLRLARKHPLLTSMGDPFYNRNLHDDPADFTLRHEDEYPQ